MNEDIRVPRVLLIDQHGEKQGVMPMSAAIEAAEEAGLDLVEIVPNADPPVCKILDYGKFKFQEQKKKNEARKKQKVVELKEINEPSKIAYPKSAVVEYQFPARGSLPPVKLTWYEGGLKPTTPQNDAGIRIEPPPSDPVARGTMPAAIAAADPPDEPPGTRVTS